MKKLNKKVIIIIAVIVVAIIGVIVASQGGNTSEDGSVHTNLLLTYTLKEEPVMNGFGDEQIGTYAYIYVSPAEMEKATPEDYVEFANQNVKDSKYNYVTIKCSDGTGACWQASMIDYLHFGKLDNNNMVTDETAVWQLDNGTYKDISQEYFSEQNK